MTYLDIASALDALNQFCHHMSLYFAQALNGLAAIEWGHAVSSMLLTILACNALIVPLVLIWLAVDLTLPKLKQYRQRLTLPAPRKEVKIG
jgi:hypothetical protein